MQGNFWVCGARVCERARGALGHWERSKWVRAAVSNSSHSETSAAERPEEPRREAARQGAAGQSALRARANSEGGRNARNEIEMALVV